MKRNPFGEAWAVSSKKKPARRNDFSARQNAAANFGALLK
jgi:hypothetical protein